MGCLDGWRTGSRARAFLFRAVAASVIAPALVNAQFGISPVRAFAFLAMQQTEGQMRPSGSYLGVSLGDISAERARILKIPESGGVEIRSVEEGSAADNAGIRPGDVLLSYNGENILGAQQLIRLVLETPPGRKVKVQLWREGRERLTVVTTGSQPSPNAVGSFPGFPFPDGRIPNVTVVPRAVLVWRDLASGVEYEELDPQLSEYFGVSGGVLIRWIEKGSAADKSDLKAGDVIIAVRHKPVLTSRDFSSCLRQPRTPATLTLIRNHKKLDVTLTPAVSE